MIDLTPFTPSRHRGEFYTFTGIRHDQSVTYHVIHPEALFRAPDGPYAQAWLVVGRKGRVPPISDPALNVLRATFLENHGE